ncbi:SDR family NAD(P)-dependent oxidoreductase [Pokkaliibacter plantistimulans]|nr:SDR family oxidoreductase [Pokkaliibacter plantistimulans]
MTQQPSGIAVVTGASSGIGKSYARQLAAAGYDLLLVARDIQRLQVLAAELQEAAAVRVEVLQADLTSRADSALVEQRLRSDERIVMLVNNAGMSVSGSFVEADFDQVESMIQLNIVALTRLARAAAEGFVQRGKGTLINIASVLALMPENFGTTYNATKAYVLSLSESLAHELGEQGVRVQAVLPGLTRTEIFDRAGGDVNALPAQMVMEVDDMVGAALRGLALGERVTVPSLPDAGQLNSFVDARRAMAPNLSLSTPAARYLS